MEPQDRDEAEAETSTAKPAGPPPRTATARFGAAHPPGAPAPGAKTLNVPGMHRRSEMPWLVGGLTILLVGWFLLNRFYFRVYAEDISEHGRFTVIRWGTDQNPSRNEQINIFDRAHRNAGLKAVVDPGNGPTGVVTRSASHNAPDVIDNYAPEVLRTFADKGIAVQLNPYLKEAHLDLGTYTWPSLIPLISQPNLAYRPGVDDPIDQRLWYAVPNNLSYPICFFNRTLYQTAAQELQKDGQPVPPEPWMGWTWWDYAALAASMQRRGPDGRFISFGGTPPSVQDLALEIGASMRGDNSASFAAMTADEKTALGLDPNLSWDDCVCEHRADADGTPVIWPNRAALRQALGFDYDLIHTYGAVPSQSDQQQMASGGGGYGGSGITGAFLAGNCGMLFTGRWYLGQIRANVNFDWHFYRMPRWVPYKEWARWQREGKGPGQRDGAWGDIDHIDRGYLVYFNTRCTFLSSSAKDPEKAFAFLKFIATDPDFNRLLLFEDGAGADYALAKDYLGKPDPLVPDESQHRPPEQELGAIRQQQPAPAWPWVNYDERANIDWNSLPSWMGQDGLETGRAPGTDADAHPELAAFIHHGGDPTLRSQPAIAAYLADRYCSAITELAGNAIASDHPAAAVPPSNRTWLMILALALIGGAVGISALRRSPYRG